MGKNNVKLLNAKQNSVVRKHMYKSKGVWKVAGVSTVALGATVLGTGLQTANAHADSLPNQNSNTTDTSQQTNSLGSSNSVEGPSTNNSAASIGSVGMDASNVNSHNADIANEGTTIKTNDNLDSNKLYKSSSWQSNNISQTDSGNNSISQASANNSSAISQTSGIEQPGSVINTTSMTSDQIASVTAKQTSMINATGSGDNSINHAVQTNSNSVNNVGGHISHNGDVNTADNMNPSQVSSIANSYVDNLNATGSGDSALLSALGRNSSADSLAGGVIKSNGSINATKLTPDEINKLVNNQITNIDNAGSFNSQMRSQAGSALSTVASGGGTLSAGSGIDVSSWTPEQINSLQSQQSTMVSATASADGTMFTNANRADEDIQKNGGTISQSGTINTADNMNPSTVESTVNDQLANIWATRAGDVEISQTAQDTNSLVNSANGILRPGSGINVTGWSPEQVAALASFQSMMIHDTGSADGTITSYATSANSDISKNGGTIFMSGTVNTADNMHPEDILSNLSSQHVNISQTASGDNVINTAVSNNSQVVSQAGGILAPGTPINVHNMNMSEIASIVNHQNGMINETGSADDHVISQVNTDYGPASDISNFGGSVYINGTINTADNMTTSDILSTLNSQDNKFSQVGSDDAILSDVVDDNHTSIADFNGVEKPGSALDTTDLTPDQIASIVAHQTSMVNATGSADFSVSNKVDSATPDITNFNGSLISDGTFNTADNMTVDQIASLVNSQNNHITWTDSADVSVSNTEYNNSDAIGQLDGKEKPGSAIDLTNFNQSQIDSIVSHQNNMVDTTGSADMSLSNVITSAEPDVTNFGGNVISDGTYNTADNMTASQIIKLVNSEMDHIGWTQSANVSVSTAVDRNSYDIYEFNGQEKPGSAIDLTNMSVDQINSIVSHQDAMVDATGWANDQVSAASDNNDEMIEDAGGHNILDSTVNTADNMTAAEVSRHAISQSVKMGDIGNADQIISNVVSENSDPISNFDGNEIAGSNINATSFTGSQIASITAHQSDMVSATGSADILVSNASDVNTPVVNSVGGNVIKDGTINTADNMNTSQISRIAKSYADRMNWVGNADTVISNALSNNGYPVSAFNGSLIAGSNVNGGMLNESQLNSLATKQANMLNATGDADRLVSNTSAGNTFDIQNNGGTISQNSTVNTADNMRPSKVSLLASINARQISAAGSGDLSISQTVANNSEDIYGFQGNEHPGSGIDISSMSVSEVASIVAHQNEMVNATGRADSTVHSASDNAIHDINAFGGQMSNDSTVNTADNQTASYLNSNASYQANQINSTASGDRVLSEIVAGNSAAISGFNGQERAGSTINTTNLPLDVINSLVNKQSAMVNATGSADVIVSRASNSATQDVVDNGGSMINAGNINTADNMTPSEVINNALSQASHIYATGSADNVISTAVGLNRGYISQANATANAGSHIDTTGLTLDEIASIASEQSAMISATGSADSHLYQSYMDAQSAASSAGTSVTNAGDINTADNMNPSQIASINAFQTDTLSAVGSADKLLYQSRLENNSLSTPFGGGITIGSAQDMTGRLPNYIDSLVQSQLPRISQVGSNNVLLSQTQQSVYNDITNFNGQVQPGSVLDVTSLNPDSVTSITNSQVATLSAVGRGDSWLNPAVQSASGYIQDAQGSFVNAGHINMGSESADDIVSFAGSQASNISHVGYADSMIADASHQATDSINTGGGQLHQLSARDAQYMSLDDIDSFGQEQSANLSEVALANPIIDSASAQNTEFANNNHGYMTSVTAADASSMTSDQISNFAKSTAARLNAVGSQDSAITSVIGQVSAAAVTLGDGLDVTNMKSNDIDDNGRSQVATISATNSTMSQLYSDAQAAQDTWGFGGHISHLSVVDTTSLRPSELDTATSSNEKRLSLVNMANSTVSQTSADTTSDINDGTAQGTIIKGHNIDLTNMSSNEINSLVTSQDNAMHYAATGNSTMGSLIRSARAAEPQHMGPQTYGNHGKISVPQRVQVTGSLQMDGWSPEKIGTYMASEAAMVKATGTVAEGLSNAEKTVTNDVMTVRSVINVNVSNLSEVNSVMDYNSATVSSAASKQASENHSFATYLGDTPHNPSPNEAQGMEPVDYLGRAVHLGGQDITMGLVPNSKQGGNIIDDGHSDNKGDNRGVRAYAPHIDNEHIVDSIHWDTNSPAPYNPSTGQTYSNDGFYVPSGTKVRFPHAVQLVSSDVGDHGYIDLDVTFSSGDLGHGNVDNSKGISVHRGPQNSITSTVSPVNRVSDYRKTFSEQSGETAQNPDFSTWPLYKKDGSIDHWHATTAWNDNTNTMKFQIVPPAGTKDTNYLFASAIGDIDTKQQVDIGDNALIGMGQDLKIQDNKVTNVSGNQYDNFSSYPNGVAVFAKYGNNITFTINNQPWAKAAGLQQAAFGTYWRLGSALYRPTFDLKTITSNVKSATVGYHPMDMGIHQDYNYTYRPLNTNYQALDTTVTPMSTKYNILDDMNGFNPQQYDTTPLAATYQKFSSDGTKVNPHNPDGSLNGKFTGYAPLDTQYKNFSTDGSKINPYNPNGTINQKFTGYTPLSINYQNYKTDGSTTDKNGNPLNPLLPNGKINPKFTGYTPLNVTYQNYSSDGSKLNPLQPNGTLNPHYSGYTPIDMHYKNFETDGSKINPYLPNGHLNPKFTGYAPLDMHYQNYETNGQGTDKNGKPLNPYLPNGHLNPKFTGYTPFNVRYKNFETNGQGTDKNGKPLNPYLPNGQLNPKFTGYTPFNVRYKNFVTDGTNINPRNPDGTLNPKFTGYTPLNGTFKRYISDGRNINPYNPDGTLNPKFTGYTPLSTTYQTYSNDGKAIGKDGKPLNPYLPNGHLNPKFTGFTPLNTTYKSYSSDGKAIGKDGKPLNPYLPNGQLNPKFTGFTPVNTIYKPISTTYKSLSTNGKGVDKNRVPLNPYLPNGKLNPKFTGFTPLHTDYSPNVPNIPNQDIGHHNHGEYVPNIPNQDIGHHNHGKYVPNIPDQDNGHSNHGKYVPNIPDQDNGYNNHGKYVPNIPDQNNGHNKHDKYVSSIPNQNDYGRKEYIPESSNNVEPNGIPTTNNKSVVNVPKQGIVNAPNQNNNVDSGVSSVNKLPQTGAAKQDLALLGLSVLTLALGAGFVGKKKKN